MLKEYSFELGSLKKSKSEFKSELNLKDNSIDPLCSVKTIGISKKELLLSSDLFNLKGLIDEDTILNRVKLNTMYSEQTLTNLIRLDLTRLNLTSIAAGTFAHLIRLSEIDLSENKINFLHANIFDGLVELRVISLRQNKLTKLAENIFNGLVHLETIDLSDNLLEQLNPNLFYGLYSLKKVLLFCNKYKANTKRNVFFFYNIFDLQSNLDLRMYNTLQKIEN